MRVRWGWIVVVGIATPLLAAYADGYIRCPAAFLDEIRDLPKDESGELSALFPPSVSGDHTVRLPTAYEARFLDYMRWWGFSQPAEFAYILVAHDSWPVKYSLSAHRFGSKVFEASLDNCGYQLGNDDPYRVPQSQL